MNVLVVGAGKGIGFESVQALLRAGHRVTAVSRDVSKLESLSSAELIVYQSDISDDSSRDQLMAAVAASGYTYNAVIITAGQLIKKPYEHLTKDDFSSLYITNVYAVFDLIRRLKSFLAKDFAHVVTIGSMGGLTGSMKFPGMVFYSSSKAALATVTECMAVEWEGEGVHINCLALGAVETDMKNAAFPEFKAPHSAREMGEWVSRFALEGGKFFNGKVLPVSISTP